MKQRNEKNKQKFYMNVSVNVKNQSPYPNTLYASTCSEKSHPLPPMPKFLNIYDPYALELQDAIQPMARY
jgi:hypothetical protein